MEMKERLMKVSADYTVGKISMSPRVMTKIVEERPGYKPSLFVEE